MKKLIATLSLAGSVLLAVVVSGCSGSSTDDNPQPAGDGSSSKWNAPTGGVAAKPTASNEAATNPAAQAGSPGAKTNALPTPAPDGSSFK